MKTLMAFKVKLFFIKYDKENRKFNTNYVLFTLFYLRYYDWSKFFGRHEKFAKFRIK